MKKVTINSGIVFLFLFSSAVFAGIGTTYGGLTGMFNIPTAEVLFNNEQAVSLHKYQIKYTYGLQNVLEIGARTSIEKVTTFEELGRNFTFNFKVRALTQKKSFIDLAGGGENTNYFLCVSKTLKELNNLDVTIGTGNGRFNWFFAGISFPLDSITRLGLEYDGSDFNSGLRMVLSNKITFDLYFKGIIVMIEKPYLKDVISEQIVFGISYTEYFNIDFSGIFK
ncbi:MAG: hypothetical protein A2452_08910 [Candidatus Firestonebacteria bacterium RIFOXYC2_FULL_39_67]|nr:MAG: hypothetical protein A2536_09590 [Candidatus Firestonebacteria bacterium RIFOXYD2_FULL_39_29]OGF53572.1 MAG: hypothetical protein A2452_08910 [Candidatus Firestonebacteria bacterium RIFOXYC2_FULL_39_67]